MAEEQGGREEAVGLGACEGKRGWDWLSVQQRALRERSDDPPEAWKKGSLTATW